MSHSFLAFISCILTVFPALLSGQLVMSTVAGTDWTFPSGQMRATAAPLGRIFNFCIDRNDNLYIPDTDNHLLLRVTPSGTLTTVAGNGLPGYSGDGRPALEASLLSPRGCGVDSASNVAVHTLEHTIVHHAYLRGSTKLTPDPPRERGVGEFVPEPTEPITPDLLHSICENPEGDRGTGKGEGFTIA